jgi:enolase-phosphatase E1
MAKAILLDLEGTTTPVGFVRDTLFPYAKARIAGFVLDNLGSLKYEMDQLVSEHAAEKEYPSDLRPDSPNSVADYLKYLMDQGRRSTPLKSIQGMIWQSAYESGEVVTPVFDDVPAALKRWKAADKAVSVFSSASVLAQQLIFRHTEQGDLTQYIFNYFDTNTGLKDDAQSYTRIAEDMGHAPADMLFVSDAAVELDAARATGMQTSLSVRPGNEQLKGDPVHQIVTTFDGLE